VKRTKEGTKEQNKASGERPPGESAKASGDPTAVDPPRCLIVSFAWLVSSLRHFTGTFCGKFLQRFYGF